MPETKDRFLSEVTKELEEVKSQEQADSKFEALTSIRPGEKLEVTPPLKLKGSFEND